MAGYGLARIKYKWADQVFFFTLVALMVPSLDLNLMYRLKGF